MIIKIIANYPISYNCSDIPEEYIGKEYNAVPYKDTNYLYIDELEMYVFDGEYEIIK